MSDRPFDIQKARDQARDFAAAAEDVEELISTMASEIQDLYDQRDRLRSEIITLRKALAAAHGITDGEHK